MAEQQLEKFIARIVFTYADQGDKPGREISYSYSREGLDSMYEIKKTADNKTQLIQVGDILTIENKKCEVKEIKFALSDEMQNVEHGYGITYRSTSKPTNFNCEIYIIVDWCS